MHTRMILNFLIESLYGTFITFFYIYVGLTFITIDPFSLGFHPPTNIEQLSLMTLGIFSIVTFVKSISLVTFFMTSEEDASRKIFYVPSQRH